METVVPKTGTDDTEPNVFFFGKEKGGKMDYKQEVIYNHTPLKWWITM